MKLGKTGILILSLMCVLICGAAAEETQTVHTYLGLDYATATADDAAAVLFSEKGVMFERSPKVLSGTAEGVKEFGYEFDIQIDFKGNYTTINRILLRSTQIRLSPEELSGRIRSDFEQFLDMEKQLSAQYGEPDRRFFYHERKSVGNKGSRHMFESGVWELDAMLNVCTTDSYFKAYSIWDNVVLMAWVDGQRVMADGKKTSRIMLTYYPSLKDTDVMIRTDVPVYSETAQ